MPAGTSTHPLSLAAAHVKESAAPMRSINYRIDYLRSGSTVEDVQAPADFAVSYADQTEQDHQILEKAVKSDPIAADTGV